MLVSREATNPVPSISIDYPEAHVNPEPLLDTLPLNAYLSLETIEMFRKTHGSRTAFARRLVRAIFRDPNDLCGKNVSGKGKLKVDPTRISWVKKVTLTKFPPQAGETAEVAWGKCIKGIDSVKRSFEAAQKKSLPILFDENMLYLHIPNSRISGTQNALENENLNDTDFNNGDN